MNKRILSEIWIYPVKGLGGIRRTSCRVMGKGLQYDRRWMLVDENNNFMTQRDNSTLALFKLSIHEAGFKITFRSHSIFLPCLHPVIQSPIEAVVWDDPVTTFEVSREHSEWFSEYLGMKCRLVSFPEENPRPVDASYKIHEEHVSLADGYPLLIIGQSSLDDLNDRLESPVPINRFRPNLVFTGGEPFEEDQWKQFTVGQNRFAGVKPCARCIVTTINQDTGEKEREPLVTLSKFRKRDMEIYFGQNVLAIDQHEIHEGDEITFG